MNRVFLNIDSNKYLAISRCNKRYYTSNIEKALVLNSLVASDVEKIFLSEKTIGNELELINM